MHKRIKIIITLTFLAILPTQASAMTDPEKYQKANMQNFSKLYWALGMMDPNNNENVDNYMAINECGIYNDYKSNEFEWQKIRESAREMLIKETPTFPTRYSIMQEINFTDYDTEREGFYISDKYDIESSRRFEVHAAETFDDVCGFKRYIPGYPKGIILELSRPLELKFIPVHKKIARAYIEDTLEEFRNLKLNRQNEDNLFKIRKAYIEVNVKIFSFIGYGKSQDSKYLAKVVGALESLKIYNNRKKETLLYAKTYSKRTKKQGIDPAVKKQFVQFLAKREKIPIEGKE